MADQCSQLVLQVESAQQVGLLTGKELDQEIYIAVFAPIAKNGPVNPWCFYGVTATEIEDFVDRAVVLGLAHRNWPSLRVPGSRRNSCTASRRDKVCQREASQGK